MSQTCSKPKCRVRGDDSDLCRVDGSYWCRPHLPVPDLVIEFRYTDMDVGAYAAEAETQRHAEALWREFSFNNTDSQPKFIVLRRADDHHDGAAVFDLADLLEQFPGLIDGEQDVNGGDLVDAMTQLVRHQFGLAGLYVCEACRKPIQLDAGTQMWQHVDAGDSDACGPAEQRAALGQEGIYPVPANRTDPD